MAEVIWSPRAIKDISEIAGYIAKESLQYAEKQAGLFSKKVSILKNHLLSGKMVSGLGVNTIRQILCGHYRIIYELLTENKIGILTGPINPDCLKIIQLSKNI